ncbi:nucleic acid/nucleotide deaminase domain-containing protein, partial [Vibrio parahaemolyticus]|nr:nucleic acid/nucleotide deaminase domain-containing protein [Vibrio parahaemolyticus]
GACFIATSKPPCKLCHVYFCATALNNNNNERRPFRVRAPHLNMYARWRLPDMDAADNDAAAAVEDRNDVLEDMVEQMQSDTVALLRDKRATWRRNDSRTDTHAGFQSALGMMMSARGGRGASVSADDVTSTRSQTEVDMAPPRYTPVGSAAPSIAGSWGCQSG